jgi:hypothetical protein
MYSYNSFNCHGEGSVHVAHFQKKFIHALDRKNVDNIFTGEKILICETDKV